MHFLRQSLQVKWTHYIYYSLPTHQSAYYRPASYCVYHSPSLYLCPCSPIVSSQGQQIIGLDECHKWAYIPSFTFLSGLRHVPPIEWELVVWRLWTLIHGKGSVFRSLTRGFPFSLHWCWGYTEASLFRSSRMMNPSRPVRRGEMGSERTGVESTYAFYFDGTWFGSPYSPRMS